MITYVSMSLELFESETEHILSICGDERSLFVF